MLSRRQKLRQRQTSRRQYNPTSFLSGLNVRAATYFSVSRQLFDKLLIKFLIDPHMPLSNVIAKSSDKCILSIIFVPNTHFAIQFVLLFKKIATHLSDNFQTGKIVKILPI